MGGSDDGDGKGTKRYGATGIIDGPDSVSTLILVEGVGELLLAGLDVDVAEEDNDCGELVDAGRDKGVDSDDDDDDDDAPGKEDGGAGEARTAAARITRMAKAHIDVQWVHPVDQLGRTGL
jgi:hypothetical protein